MERSTICWWENSRNVDWGFFNSNVSHYQTWLAGKYTIQTIFSSVIFLYRNPNFEWISNCHVWLPEGVCLGDMSQEIEYIYVLCFSCNLGFFMIYLNIECWKTVISGIFVGMKVNIFGILWHDMTWHDMTRHDMTMGFLLGDIVHFFFHFLGHILCIYLL